MVKYDCEMLQIHLQDYLQILLQHQELGLFQIHHELL